MRTSILRFSVLLPIVVAAPAAAQAPRVGAPVQWRAFVGDWPELPRLDGLAPSASGVAARISLEVAPRPDRYALRFDGHLEVAAPGRYLLSTESDDGSRLWLGHRLVVDNGGSHARRRVEAEVRLTAGRHPFRLDYHEAGGAEHLELGIEGPIPAIEPAAVGPAGRDVLWYGAPAKRWVGALPLGNGRLGAMVFGGVDEERLQLNEDSMWPGRAGPDPTAAKPADIGRWREMLFRGEHAAVDREVMPAFSMGEAVRSHQTMGDLQLAMVGSSADVDSYRRSLDLATGIAEVRYRRGGVQQRREALVSAPHQVLALHLSADVRGQVAFDLGLSRPADGGRPTVEVEADAERGRVVMRGRLTQAGSTFGDGDPAQAFVVVAEVLADGGQLSVVDGRLQLRMADTATVLVAGETEWYGVGPEARAERRIAAARGLGFDALRAAHVAEHRPLFDAVGLRLAGGGAGAESAGLPTDRRLDAVRGGAVDPGLDALLFQYGRYLLIASSRPGSLPANLQGLWNEHIRAPWNADYHLNINLQMNYWPAEVTGLAAMHEPLFAFTERLAAEGAVRARDAFGMRGWVTGHATDVFATAWHRSVQPYWGFWHHGGGWLMQHLVEHWRFGGDDEWMRARGWPLLAGCARFYLDWLCEDPESGALVSGPSTSPENSFLLADGQRAAVCMGPAMDQQIIAQVFRDLLEVGAALGIDDPLVDEVRGALARLAPGVRLGPDGRILEWHRPVAEAEPGHRHMSQLWALFPGDAVDPVRTPEQAVAARRTIEHRLQHGGAGTGWSRAWMICFMARLHDGAAAYENLQMLFRRSMAENLFDLHPPFQIDGNFGATAGIAEMLLQSTGGVIEVLPSLPAAWAEGEFRGLRARGGFAVDVTWSEGAWTAIEVRSALGRACALRAAALDGARIEDADGALVEHEIGADGSLRFATVAGRRYRLTR
jgi:alpha-L-fucosidase 2